MKVETKMLVTDVVFVMFFLVAGWTAPIVLVNAINEMVITMEDLGEARQADRAVKDAMRIFVNSVNWPLSEEEWGVRFMEVASLGDEAAVLRDRIRAGHRAPRDAKGRLYRAGELKARLRSIEETAKRAGYMPVEYRSP